MAARFVIIYCLMVPFILHSAVIVLTLIDKGQNAKLEELMFFWIIAGILLLMMVLSAFFFLSITSGLGFLGGSGYVLFLAIYMF